MLFQSGESWCPSENHHVKAGDLTVKLSNTEAKHRHIMAMDIHIEKQNLHFPKFSLDDDSEQLYSNVSIDDQRQSTIFNSCEMPAVEVSLF